MNKVVVDASALLALIKNEPGAEVVEALFGRIVMSTLNVCEVATQLMDSHMTFEECEMSILPFISQLVNFDEKQAFCAAELEKQTKHIGLSLADRACLALGIAMNLPIYTANPSWGDLSLPNAEIKLIR